MSNPSYKLFHQTNFHIWRPKKICASSTSWYDYCQVNSQLVHLYEPITCANSSYQRNYVDLKILDVGCIQPLNIASNRILCYNITNRIFIFYLLLELRNISHQIPIGLKCGSFIDCVLIFQTKVSFLSTNLSQGKTFLYVGDTISVNNLGCFVRLLAIYWIPYCTFLIRYYFLWLTWWKTS